MKKLNKERYPEKWREFSQNYSSEEAEKMYYKFCRAFTLEKCILKHGEEKGKEIYFKRKANFGVTLEKCILKHGKEKGEKVYFQWKNSTGGSLKNFILRYGEEKGVIKYNEFRKKCIIKDKYKLDPSSNYNSRSFNTTLEHYINKYGVTLEEAKLMLSDRQATSTLQKFISRYGEEEGKIKYQKTNLLKSNTLENFILRYGEREGIYRYNKKIDLTKESLKRENLIKKFGEEKYREIAFKRSNTLSSFISRYGEEEGKIKYREFIVNNFGNRKRKYSKLSIYFFELLVKEISNNIEINDIYFKDKEFDFYPKNFEFIGIKVDFYIKSLNKVIEFYGDYWHRNPNIFLEKESELIRKRDEERINILKNEFNCQVFTIWESDVKEDVAAVLEDCLNFIYNE